MATHSSILAREIPQIEEPARLQSMGLLRAGHNLVIKHPPQIFHCLCIPYLLDPLIYCRTLRLPPRLSYCEQGCRGRRDTQIFLNQCLVSLGKYPVMEWPDYMVVLFLAFRGNLILVFKVTAPVCIPPTGQECSPSFMPSPTLVSCLLSHCHKTKPIQ